MFSNRLEISSEGLENPSKPFLSAPPMPSASIADEMAAIVRQAAAPVQPGESVGALVNRAARRLGLGPRRARAYWYGEVRNVPAEEADRLRAARRTVLRDQARDLALTWDRCCADADEIESILQELRRAG